MPEDIETSLNWPDRGLRGVPEPSADAEPADGATGAGGAADASDVGTTPLYDTELGEGISTIARSIDEFSSSTSELRSFLEGHTDASEDEVATKMSDALRGAELALIRLEQAAGTVSGKLESIAGALGHQFAGLTTQLEFDQREQLPDLDISLPSRAGFQGGLPGITPNGIAMDPTTGLPVYSGGTVTWPPLLPPRKKTIWTRLAHPAVAIPLGLVLLAAVSYGTYRVVKHETHTPSPTVAALGGTKGFGSVKVISGTTCQAGTTTASMQLASSQYKDGLYFIGVTGTLSNAATSHLSQVRVTWDVTYADGYTATQTTPVNNGLAIGSKTSKSWTAFDDHSEGTVPPVSARVIRISAHPAQPACS